MFENDNQTESIVMVGEIGGTAEEEAAEYIKSNISKKKFGQYFILFQKIALYLALKHKK